MVVEPVIISDPEIRQEPGLPDDIHGTLTSAWIMLVVAMADLECVFGGPGTPYAQAQRKLNILI